MRQEVSYKELKKNIRYTKGQKEQKKWDRKRDVNVDSKRKWKSERKSNEKRYRII